MHPPETLDWADDVLREAGHQPDDPAWPRERKRLLDELAERAWSIAEADGEPAPGDAEYWMAIAEMGDVAGAVRFLRGEPRPARLPLRSLALGGAAAALVGIGIALAALPALEGGAGVEAERVFRLDRGVSEPTTDVWVEDFTVREGFHELQLRPSVYVVNGGAIETSLYGPSGERVFHRYTTSADYFVRIQPLPPEAGAWRLVVELHGFQGPVELTVVGLFAG